MSKVERLELYHVDVPLETPFFPSWIPGYPMTHNRFTLLKVYSSDGAVGHAAGTAFTHERQGIGDLLGGFLLGLPVDDLQSVRERLREASYLGWRNWWIEAAFWELEAKQKGLPVYKLMSGSDETVEKAKVYASTGTLKTIEERMPYLDQIRKMGIEAIKMRVHYKEEKDDRLIMEQVRKELGDDFVIGVDANQGWPVSLIDKTHLWDLDRATRFCKFCDDLNIAWVEEPLDMHNFKDYATLRKQTKTKIAGAELHQDIVEVRTMMEYEGLDKYQPDATFSGLTLAKWLMKQCGEKGLDYSPHTWSNGLGLIINLHCFAAWKNRTWLEYPYETPGWVPQYREGIIPPVPVNSDGTIDVPQAPGFGFEIDNRLLRKYGKRFAVTTPLRLAVKTIREKGLKTALELKKKKEGKA